jgi:hypothetical protein
VFKSLQEWKLETEFLSNHQRRHNAPQDGHGG